MLRTVCSPSSLWKIDNFNDFLIDHKIFYSLTGRLAEVPHAPNNGDRPLLDVALCHRKGSRQWRPHAKTISLLLNMGADPNETFGDGLSVWANFLLMRYRAWHRGKQDLNTLVQILGLLLWHGADPEEVVPVGRGESGRVVTASRLIRKILPHDADWLLSKAEPRS